MDSWGSLFEAYFAGDVAPGRVKSKDVADIITAIKFSIAVMIHNEHPEIIKKDAVIVEVKAVKVLKGLLIPEVRLAHLYCF
ncbi:hypothetical protein D0962_18905 [Leptolyngbyaceae cyanobacterium CCMR0082]|uniref:Uncharacterized protein n=1 Tax=Adonisia turfae CCMR0082 TaxID=2304604 RepID=A0A6M0SA01_9CYAN|nr:hypothetical protein [Adonisia turfae]NEZ64831.1 hypothetical protein [Adonisia turfae CCMR0082]